MIRSLNFRLKICNFSLFLIQIKHCLWQALLNTCGHDTSVKSIYWQIEFTVFLFFKVLFIIRFTKELFPILHQCSSNWWEHLFLQILLNMNPTAGPPLRPSLMSIWKNSWWPYLLECLHIIFNSRTSREVGFLTFPPIANSLSSDFIQAIYLYPISFLKGLFIGCLMLGVYGFV